MQTPGIAGLQFDVAWENAEANCSRVAGHFAARPPRAGSLVVLPEMLTTGFSMNPGAAAQPAGGPAESTFAGLARSHAITLVAGLAVAQSDGTYSNEAVVFDPLGSVVARYRKQRPFVPGGENTAYPAGSEPTRFSWAGLTVAPFICYDLRFPEIFRVAALRWRPELFVVIASWPDKRILHWVKLIQARAIENQAYVIGVNRIGSDPLNRHVGRSVIADPHGHLVADAGENEGWLEAGLDLERLREYRTTLPFLDDLKPVTF